MERATMMTTMKHSIFNVLETMFFQLVEFDDRGHTIQNWFSKNALLLGSVLDFKGPVSGGCYLLIPEQRANEITADFLGIAVEDVDEKQRDDTIKETLNMIGGKMLSELDKKGDFCLGIPKVMSPDQLSHDKLDQFKDNPILIEAEEGRLAAGFYLD